MLSCLRRDASASSPDVPSPPTLGPAGSRWRDYSALAIIMAGIAFGFHQLYKVSCPSLHPLGAALSPGAAVGLPAEAERPDDLAR